MRFLSLFSGIEAASVAWEPLGWQAVAFSEVEPFCCELLRQRFPTVPNLGDVTADDFIERAKALGPIDLVVGGSPCQSFSVAGLRGGMNDARGNLALRFVEVVDGLDPAWTLWENVPGVLSDKTNGFGCLLGALAGSGAALVPPLECGWTDAGVVAGPRRSVAWRCLDAQWFGLAQRRKRVFALAGRGVGAERVAEVLLEREGVRRDPPTRRAQGEGVAADVAPSLGASGRGVARGGESRGQDPVVACFGGNNTGGEVDVATACNAHGGTGRSDFESETFVAHSLRADGFDASDGGTGRGRGTPLVPIQCNGTNIGTELPSMRRGDGGTTSGVPCVAFHATQDPISGEVSPARGQGSSAGCGSVAVCFSSKDHGADAGDIAPTLRAAGHDGSHANAGAPPAVAFQEAQTVVREYASAGSLRANGPGHDPVGTRVREGMAVRRLTPRECERLMGQTDDWTAIKMPTAKQKAAIVKSYRDEMNRINQGNEMTLREAWKDAADGPRYKALGNSMAVPVMVWIGRRIAEVET